MADPSLSQSATQYVNQFWTAWSGPSSTALTYIKFAASDPIGVCGVQGKTSSPPIMQADSGSRHYDAGTEPVGVRLYI